jgi:hypothetical protein
MIEVVSLTELQFTTIKCSRRLTRGRGRLYISCFQSLLYDP